VELLVSVAKIFLGVAIGLPLVVYLLQDGLIFHPMPLSDAQRAQVRARFPAVEEIFLESDNQRIHAWHVKAGAGAPLLLYFGGNAEEVSWMIGEAQQKTPGVSWLLVSYRGYGASEGKPSQTSITADALKWHDHAVRELKPKQVFAFGRSLGSGAAVQLAAARPLAGVVLVTPFDSLTAVAKRYYWYLPVDLLLRHRFDSLLLAPKITTPLLCIAAERDEVIPPEHARRLYEAWAGPKQWVGLPGASHNGIDGLPVFWNSIRGFLNLPGM
jgi:pimeloyl-ACP methyl ester carboxylesterase